MVWLVRFLAWFVVGFAVARARVLLGLVLLGTWIGLTSAQGRHAHMNETIAATAFFLWLAFRVHGGFVRHRSRVGWDH